VIKIWAKFDLIWENQNHASPKTLVAGLHDHFNRGRLSIEAFFSQSFFFFPIWKLFNYLWLAGKSLDRKPAAIEVIM